jgi:hypothetical protein
MGFSLSIFACGFDSLPQPRTVEKVGRPKDDLATGAFFDWKNPDAEYLDALTAR